MKDKFTYYDFIANIIPSVFLWWGLSFLPFIKTAPYFSTGAIVEQSIVFIVVIYVFGLAIQFLAKYSIEPLIKKCFWHNNFFSQIYLIKAYGKIAEAERTKLLALIRNILGYNENDLKLLDVSKIKDEEISKAKILSNTIYKRIDAITRDKGRASKAHMQNSMYSLYRGLSFVCFVIFIIFCIYLIFDVSFRQLANGALFILFFCFTVIFVFRARERGELYIKGLFYSLQEEIHS